MSSRPPSRLNSTPTPSPLQSPNSETPLPTISVSDSNIEVQVGIEIQAQLQAQPNRDAALQERPPHTANTIPNTSTESLTTSPLTQDQETTTPRPLTTTSTRTTTTTTNARISRVLEIQFSITIDLITRTGERTRTEREITLRTPYHPPDLDAQATEAYIRMLYAEDADIEERVSIAVSRADARIRNAAGSVETDTENDTENDAETHAGAYAGAYAMSTETGSESNARDEDETNALAIAESNARAATRRQAAARTTSRGRGWWRIGVRELSTGLERGREREMEFRPRGRGRGWGGQRGSAA